MTFTGATLKEVKVGCDQGLSHRNQQLVESQETIVLGGLEEPSKALQSYENIDGLKKLEVI